MSKRDSFLLRLPPEILDALRSWAEDEFRSANSQIEVLLTQALKKSGRMPRTLAAKAERAGASEGGINDREEDPPASLPGQ